MTTDNPSFGRSIIVTIESEAREAVPRGLVGEGAPAFIEGYLAGASRPITDDMVERGLKVSREFPMKRGLDNAQNVMRAVLEAALNPKTTTHENRSEA